MQKDPKVRKDVEIKGQGNVPLKQVQEIPNPSGPKPFGAGESRGGGIALRGKKFQGIF
jgi:hypothetical protein